MLTWEEEISLGPPLVKDYRQLNDYRKRELASPRYEPSIGYPKQSGEPWKHKHTSNKNELGSIYVHIDVYAKIITRGHQFQRGGEAWKEVEGGDITELKRRTGKVEVMSLYLN